MSHELGEMLVKAGKISDEQLARALELQKKSDEKLGPVLVQMGAISDEDELSEFIGRQLFPASLEVVSVLWHNPPMRRGSQKRQACFHSSAARCSGPGFLGT